MVVTESSLVEWFSVWPLGVKLGQWGFILPTEFAPDVLLHRVMEREWVDRNYKIQLAN